MTRVQTQHGLIEGERRGAHTLFRGVPFAKPPLGRLRFRAPEPLEPWAGVRPALAFGPSSVQAPSTLSTNTVPQPFSEDCLYLNVFTPAADGGKRPVFFWIHGGAFTVGAGGKALYDGGRLAERGDVVVVTINYRLGALGFSQWSAEERARLGVTCNAGSLDQLAALRWVHDNIAAFGGDPECVTIAGESAGAYSVAVLLCMPAARGLFKRAITQSGARLTRGQADPLLNTRRLKQWLEISEDRPEVLWELPAERFVAAQQVLARSDSAAVLSAFSPAPDGDTLPLPLDQAIARGESSAVPLLIGTNRDEMNLFLGPALKKLNEPLADAARMKQLHDLLPGVDDARLDALFELYRRTRTQRQLPHVDRALLAAISSDALWRIPSMRFAEAHRLRQPATYQYLFTYESPAMRGALRSCHALELGFVFGTLDSPGQPEFAGRGEALQGLSERMMASWLAFTRTGDPTWPAYDLERRPTMVFNLASGLEYAPYEDERAAWDDLSPRPLH